VTPTRVATIGRDRYPIARIATEQNEYSPGFLLVWAKACARAWTRSHVRGYKDTCAFFGSSRLQKQIDILGIVSPHALNTGIEALETHTLAEGPCYALDPTEDVLFIA